MSLMAALLALSLDAAPPGAQALAQPLSRAPSGQFLIPVSIEGEGPWPFMIDTGASHTTLALPVAEALGFISTREALHPVQTLTAETLEERLVIHDVRFGPVRAERLNAVVAPVAGAPLQGLLGLDALAGTRVRLDLPKGEIVFHVSSIERTDGLIDAEHGVAVMEARVHGVRGPVAVLVDTGSGFTLINSALARQLSRQGVTRMRVAGITRNSPSAAIAERARMERVRLGGVCAQVLNAVRSDVDMFRALGWRDRPAMVLGLDLLQHAVITVDGPEGAFQLDAGSPELACRD